MNKGVNPTIKRLTVLSALIAYFTLHVPSSLCAAPCPCDIYEAAGTPCVAAHSMVRALYQSYNGPLYQVRRTADNVTKDIGLLSPGGYVNMAIQDSFLNGKAGTISIIYDQSPNKNHLPKAPKSLWQPNGGTESRTSDGKHKVNGYNVNGIYVTGYSSNVAYRNNACTGIATGDQPETMYMVVDGKRYSDQCCFDYGNATPTGNADGNGTMEAVYFGNDITWGGKGEGNGPWIAADLEVGVFKSNKGGWQSQDVYTPSAKSIVANYVTAMLKGPSGNHFTLKGGSAQSGTLTTMWDGVRPSPGYSPKKLKGAIILGTGGDGSNGGTGTFFEGAMTRGVPTDAVDDAIQANIVAAGYGRTTTSLEWLSNEAGKIVSPFTIHHNSPSGKTAIAYTLQQTGHVTLTLFDQAGRQIATVTRGTQSVGRHEAVLDVKRIPPGIYIAKLQAEGRPAWAGRIAVGK